MMVAAEKAALEMVSEVASTDCHHCRNTGSYYGGSVF